MTYGGLERYSWGFVEECSAWPGAVGGSPAFCAINRELTLPDFWLSQIGSPIPIIRAKLWIDGAASVAGNASVGLVFDKDRRFLSQSNFPQTQAGDFSLGQCDMIDVAPSTGMVVGKEDFDPPILYRPGVDGIYLNAEAASGTGGLLMGCIDMMLPITTTPIGWQLPPFPLPIPANGNDANTLLFIHGSSPIRDASWRNYVLRPLGNLESQNGQLVFDGVGTVLATELMPPGYLWGNPGCCEWPSGKMTWQLDLTVTPTLSSPVETCVVATAAGLSPFQVYQEPGGIFALYSGSTAGTGWDVADKVSMGSATAGQATQLRLGSDGIYLYTWNDGILVNKLPIPNGLFNPYNATTGAGRLTFGAAVNVNQNNATVSGGYYWAGKIGEIRYRNVLDATGNYAP